MCTYNTTLYTHVVVYSGYRVLSYLHNIIIILYTCICTYVRTLLFSHDPYLVLLSSLYAHSLAVGMYVHVVNGMIRR